MGQQIAACLDARSPDAAQVFREWELDKLLTVREATQAALLISTLVSFGLSLIFLMNLLAGVASDPGRLAHEYRQVVQFMASFMCFRDCLKASVHYDDMKQQVYQQKEAAYLELREQVAKTLTMAQANCQTLREMIFEMLETAVKEHMYSIMRNLLPTVWQTTRKLYREDHENFVETFRLLIDLLGQNLDEPGVLAACLVRDLVGVSQSLRMIKDMACSSCCVVDCSMARTLLHEQASLPSKARSQAMATIQSNVPMSLSEVEPSPPTPSSSSVSCLHRCRKWLGRFYFWTEDPLEAELLETGTSSRFRSFRRGSRGSLFPSSGESKNWRVVLPGLPKADEDEVALMRPERKVLFPVRQVLDWFSTQLEVPGTVTVQRAAEQQEERCFGFSEPPWHLLPGEGRRCCRCYVPMATAAAFNCFFGCLICFLRSEPLCSRAWRYPKLLRCCCCFWLIIRTRLHERFLSSFLIAAGLKTTNLIYLVMYSCTVGPPNATMICTYLIMAVYAVSLGILLWNVRRLDAVLDIAADVKKIEVMQREVESFNFQIKGDRERQALLEAVKSRCVGRISIVNEFTAFVLQPDVLEDARLLKDATERLVKCLQEIGEILGPADVWLSRSPEERQRLTLAMGVRGKELAQELKQMEGGESFSFGGSSFNLALSPKFSRPSDRRR